MYAQHHSNLATEPPTGLWISDLSLKDLGSSKSQGPSQEELNEFCSTSTPLLSCIPSCDQPSAFETDGEAPSTTCSGILSFDDDEF